jgi:hypothetical protein
MPFGRSQISTALATGDLSVFVGQIENDYFDGKDQPYQVAADSGKREAAKDVSAFANAAGGWIVIGLRTKPSAVHFADEVEEVRLVTQQLVNTLQLRDILNSWIYPPVEGLTVQFFPSMGDATKGLVAIDIPAQREELKPFLIVRSFDGSRHVESMFGYVERKGDGNSPLALADLQRALRSGLHFENRLKTQLDRIEDLLTSRDVTAAAEQGTEETVRLLDDRIQNALRGGSRGTGT